MLDIHRKYLCLYIILRRCREVWCSSVTIPNSCLQDLSVISLFRIQLCLSGFIELTVNENSVFRWFALQRTVLITFPLDDNESNKPIPTKIYPRSLTNIKNEVHLNRTHYSPGLYDHTDRCIWLIFTHWQDVKWRYWTCRLPDLLHALWWELNKCAYFQPWIYTVFDYLNYWVAYHVVSD